MVWVRLISVALSGTYRHALVAPGGERLFRTPIDRLWAGSSLMRRVGSTTVSCPTPHFLVSGRDAKPETRLNRGLLMRFKSRAVRSAIEGQPGIIHQPVCGELWRMSAAQDRGDNVGGQEGDLMRRETYEPLIPSSSAISLKVRLGS
jgi:hypothetical protein